MVSRAFPLPANTCSPLTGRPSALPSSVTPTSGVILCTQRTQTWTAVQHNGPDHPGVWLNGPNHLARYWEYIASSSAAASPQATSSPPPTYGFIYRCALRSSHDATTGTVCARKWNPARARVAAQSCPRATRRARSSQANARVHTSDVDLLPYSGRRCTTRRRRPSTGASTAGRLLRVLPKPNRLSRFGRPPVSHPPHSISGYTSACKPLRLA